MNSGRREAARQTNAVPAYPGKLEAWIGFGPMNKGFADLRLTTWLPRLDFGNCCTLHPKTEIARDNSKNSPRNSKSPPQISVTVQSKTTS